MEKSELIPATEFCTYYEVSYTLISGLEEAGLIEIVRVEEQPYLHSDQLAAIEKLVRFHTELEINIEGIEVISYLLERMKGMQAELRSLQQKLRIYDEGII